MPYREPGLARAIVIDFDADVPLYRQIADGVRALIARRELEAGDELPSVRKLGSMLGVNLNTVAKAYRVLADEHVIALDHGKVAHVIEPPQEERPIDGPLRGELSDLVGRMRVRGASERQVRKAFEEVLARFYGRVGAR